MNTSLRINTQNTNDFKSILDSTIFKNNAHLIPLMKARREINSLSEADYKQLIKMVGGQVITMVNSTKEFVTKETHLKIIKNCFAPVKEIIEDENSVKSLDVAINEFIKTQKEKNYLLKKRIHFNKYSTSEIESLKKEVDNINRTLKKVFYQKKDGTETIWLYSFMCYQYESNIKHKFPKLKLKPNKKYGYELFIEYYAPTQIKKDKSVVIEYKRTTTLFHLNQVHQDSLFLESIGTILFIYDKIKNNYVFTFKENIKSIFDYKTIDKQPYESMLLLPTLYTYLDYLIKIGDINSEYGNDIRSAINSLAKYLYKIPHSKEFKKEDFNYVDYLSDFSNKKVTIFQDYLMSLKNDKDERLVGNTAIDNYFTYLRSLINKIIIRNHNIPSTYRNPFTGYSITREDAERHVIYEKEQLNEVKELILETKDTQLLNFIKFIFFSGIRPKELRFLQIKHIDFKTNYLNLPGTITKNGKPRDIPFLYDELIDMLSEMKLDQYDKEDYVFSILNKPSLKCVGKNYFGNHFKKIKNKAKTLTKNHDLYSFRHLFAMNYMLDNSESGTDDSKEYKIYTLKELMGHESIIQTSAYLRKFGTRLKEKIKTRNTVNF